MKLTLWISMVAVIVFALALDAFAQFAPDDNRPIMSAQERFAKDVADRAQPAAYAEAKKTMLAEAARRKQAGEKAPSFMGYELGIPTSDLDKETVLSRKDIKPGKKFYLANGGYTAVSNDLYLDADQKYQVSMVILRHGFVRGPYKNNIEHIIVRGNLFLNQTQKLDWMRCAIAVVEQKTGRKPDVVKEDELYAKWNAKTYEVEIHRLQIPRDGIDVMEIKVRICDNDPKKIKPAI